MYRIDKEYFNDNLKFYESILSLLLGATEIRCFEEDKLYDEEDTYKIIIVRTNVGKTAYKYIIKAIENSDFGDSEPPIDGHNLDHYPGPPQLSKHKNSKIAPGHFYQFLKPA